jgi:hypothetical protein
LREQKSYKIRRFSLQIEVEGEDLLLFIEPIRRLSYIYDEIHIISSKDLSRIRDAFHYDNTLVWGTKSPLTPLSVEGGAIVFYDTHDISARLGLS